MQLLRALFILHFSSICCTFADSNNHKQKWLEFKVRVYLCLIHKNQNLFRSVLTVFLFPQKTYNKQYSTLEEEKHKFITFIHNQKKIFKHNQLHSLGQVTYKLRSNEFADLTHAEFLAKYVNDRVMHDER